MQVKMPTHTQYFCCLLQSLQQVRNKGRIQFTVAKQDLGKLQSAGKVFGKGGSCNAEVTGVALDFPDERAYAFALPIWFSQVFLGGAIAIG